MVENSSVFVLLGLEGQGTDGERKVFHNSGENVVLSFDKLRVRRGILRYYVNRY